MAENYNIPQKVVNAFSELTEMYGDCIEYLGEKNNKHYFWFNIPLEIDYGFPQVVYWEHGKVTNVDGFEAVEILDFFDSKY
ncbi:MAG: hypothetical protein II360_03480 [Muribaculaceae bacterium]|nr:hypothetical protein [Muribaculaceae bacterium]